MQVSDEEDHLEQSSDSGNSLNQKRKLEHEAEFRKRFKPSQVTTAGNSESKIINKRKNIRKLLGDDNLADSTRQARNDEELRLQRLRQEVTKDEVTLGKKSYMN